MRVFARRSVLAIALLITVVATVRSLQATDSLDETRRLAAFGKVWGLLKYYQPSVAGGDIDWDAALIEAMPRVKAAQDLDEFNHEVLALVRWSGMALPFPASEALLPRDVFGWLDDSSVFHPAVAAHLKAIVLANQPAPSNRYVKGVHGVGNPDFAGDTGGYDGPSYPDEPRRLLALFRYWNMVHYFCPNRGLTDRKWEEVLALFVPRMQQAADATSYHLALAELIACLDDAHAVAASSVLSDYWGSYRAPLRTRFIEGQTVVVHVFPRLIFQGADVRAGDIITAIDGAPTATVRARFRKYISASNPDSLERDIDSLLLRSPSASRRLLRVVHDGGETTDVAVDPISASEWAVDANLLKDSTIYRVMDGNIGYVAMGLLETGHVPAAMAALRNTRAIILDIRSYPKSTMWPLMPYLEPAAAPMARFIAPDFGRPGSFAWTPPIVLGPSTPNPDYYKGRLVVLMDERTQSQAEYSVMGFQSAPATTVIGSRTAGADGNVSLIRLPGRFHTYFSGITPYYPDGRPTQRIGLVPDIEVRPTIAGIRQGRDEVLEAAIAFIDSQPLLEAEH